MKTLDIEAALRWAYREELPKVGSAPKLAPGFGSSWNLKGYLERGGIAIDCTNEYGLVPIEFCDDRAHPDAIILGRAVAGLDSGQVTIPEGWDPFSDTWASMGHLRALAVAQVKAAIVGPNGVRTKASTLIIKHAILGGAPDCGIEAPKIKTVCSSNGKPKWFVQREIVDARLKNTIIVEVDGWDVKAKRPLQDAYRKQYLEPSPVNAGVCRWEYELWVRSLDKLAETRLESIILVQTWRSRRPWEGVTQLAASHGQLQSTPAR